MGIRERRRFARKGNVIVPLLAVIVALLSTLPAAATESTTTTTVPDSTTTTTPTSTTTTTLPPTTTTLPQAEEEPAESPEVVEDPGLLEEAEDLLPLPQISFPVEGGARYSDTYNAPRDGGARLHKGTDLFASAGTPIVAVAAGRIDRIGVGEKAGQFVSVRHDDGWQSVYVHLNNDSPGTDNGLASGYGPGVFVGARVQPGTVIGFLGDSGNAEHTAPHLHFELRQPDGLQVNPYPALRSAPLPSSVSLLPTVDYDQVMVEDAELVSHIDVFTGMNSEIRVLDGHAYMGTSGNSRRCPGAGVRVVDVSDPAQPQLDSAFADHQMFPNTAADSVWVGNVRTEAFTGRLSVVGLSGCKAISEGPEAETVSGLAVFDLTDPAAPLLVSTLPAPAADGDLTEMAVANRQDSVVAATLESTEIEDGSNVPSVVSFFDITDPVEPAFLGRAALEIELDSEAEVVSEETASSSTAEADLRWVADGVVEVRWGEWAAVVSISPETRSEPAMALDAPAADVVSLSHVQDRHVIEVVEASLLPAEVDIGTDSILTTDDSGLQIVTTMDEDTPFLDAEIRTAPSLDPQHPWEEGTLPEPQAVIVDVAYDNGYLFVVDRNSGLWIFRPNITLREIESVYSSE